MADTHEVDGNATLTGWRTLGQASLNSRVRDEILRMITEKQLVPGDRLPPERELAAALKVSRPTAREAVRSLQAEGRLSVKHGQGVFVAEPGVRRQLLASMAELDHSLGELFAMREILEVPAARWAAERNDAAALAAVQEAFDRLDHALAREPLDFEELQQLDSAFHLRIVQAAGNRLLEQTQNVLHELMHTGMQTTLAVPGRVKHSSREHLRILESLLAGDAAGAARAAGVHVRAARAAANRRIAAAAAGSAPAL